MTLRFDGRLVAASSGATLLDVAAKLGVTVPVLCHDPRLPPEPACWVCLVEVRDGERWLLEPACATAARAGMEVRTTSAEVRRARRWALELLLSDHWADCVAPCSLSCPAGVDIPRYIAAVAEGRHDDAVAVIRETNPLPAVCGRICPHPCEGVCHRRHADEPVAVNLLKRLATESCNGRAAARIVETLPATGRTLSIVGAGPAGLSAAYFLRLLGHQVVVYEAQAAAGGVLRYGIPEYRLPLQALEDDLSVLHDMGVRFVFGRRLGVDLSLGEIFEAGSSAVLVAIGAWAERPLDLPGGDLRGPGGEAPEILGGLDFLKGVREGTRRRLSGSLAVVGGGNTAIDVARTALRLGAAPVTVLYRRSREQMPAFDEEIEDAIAEGVRLHCLVAPVAVDVDAGGVLRGVRLERMELGEPGSDGRPRPIPVPGSEHLLGVDRLVLAVGELPDLKTLEVASGRLSGPGPITLDPGTCATSLPGVFAAGDFLQGPTTVVDAIGSGRRAAITMDHYLRSASVAVERPPVYSRRSALAEPGPADLGLDHPAPRARPGRARGAGPALEEEAPGYLAEEGLREAERCLGCGCDAFSRCSLRPLMSEYRVVQGRAPGRMHRYPVRDLRPGLRLDMNRCIRCRRCVRVCDQVVGVGALELIFRGFDTRLLFAVVPGGEAARGCDACLDSGPLCASCCPTGAILEPSARDARLGRAPGGR